MKKKNKKSIKAKRTPNSSANDIIKLILADHKPLKRLLKVLKNDDKYSVGERQKAFAEFHPLLEAHAKPEEQTLYSSMKDQEKLRSEAFEGDVEHGLADQMVEEARRATDIDLWTAKVKVLAELVEHHIQEEETDLLPDFKRYADVQEREGLGQNYKQMRQELLKDNAAESIPEAQIKEQGHVSHATH